MAQNIFTAIGIAIALGVAAIGYFQWRTAHQRIIFDLLSVDFRRMSRSDKQYLITPRCFKSRTTRLSFLSRRKRVPSFYSGMRSSHPARYRDLVTVHVASRLPPAPTQDYQDQQRECREADKRLVALPSEFDALLIPYMRMNRKCPLCGGPFSCANRPFRNDGSVRRHTPT